MFEACGTTLDVEEWTATVGIWRPDVDWYDVLRGRGGSPPERDAFDSERRRHFATRVRMEPLEGIVQLLDELHAADVPTAIASSASGRWVRRAVEEMGLGSRFTTIVTGDEVEHVKPAPDVYLEAARRLGVAPSDVVAIEDSAAGLAAAKAAGMSVIVIPHWLTAGHDLSAADLRVAHAGELSLSRLQALASRTAATPRQPNS